MSDSSYKFNLYVSNDGTSKSSVAGYVNISSMFPILDRKLAVGDVIYVDGTVKRTNYSMKCLYMSIFYGKSFYLGDWLDFETNPKSLKNGVKYQNMNLSKGQTGSFHFSYTVTQEMLDDFQDEHPELELTGDVMMSYLGFMVTAGTHSENLNNNNPLYICNATGEVSKNYGFLLDGRQAPVLDANPITFFEYTEYQHDTSINGMTPYEYFGNFIADVSDPTFIANYTVDSRDPLTPTYATLEYTDPNGVTEQVTYWIDDDGTRYPTDPTAYGIGEKTLDSVDTSSVFHYHYRLHVPGIYSYTLKVGLEEDWDTYVTHTGTFTVYPAYPTPNLTNFIVDRTTDPLDPTATDLIYGMYEISSNINDMLDSAQAPKLRTDTKLTLSFTRLVDIDGTPTEIEYKHNAASTTPQGGTTLWQGLLLNYTKAQWDINPNPSPSPAYLQLGNEELFLVTVTLTNGIDTVTMSAWLEANFAIFNCNAAKNSVGIGKYCDGTFTGLDVDMSAKFRHDVEIDGALTLGTTPIELLWVNPSPNSSISGSKTMSRAVQDGELLICGFKYNTGSTIAAWHNFCFVGVDTMTLFAGNASNNRNGTRALTFTAGSSSVTVGSCTFNDATHNDYLVPVYIAAIKGFKLTSTMMSEWTAPT